MEIWKKIENTTFSISNYGNVKKRKKKIIAKSIETMEVIQFNSVADAERYFNTRHITDVLKGKRNQAKGYHFSYLEGGGDAKWI